ncbi:MAG: SET domain-containing protein [Verrucomicrobiia bacterium]
MLLEFRESPIHGTGAFAAMALPAGTRVVQYLGRKITKAESMRQCELNNPFIFYLDSHHDLDGNVAWNPARLLNHSCTPNCEAQHLDDGIFVVATRDIEAGEEVTFNYGYDLENFREYPCHCGSPECVRYIVAEEFHEQLRRTNREASAD